MSGCFPLVLGKLLPMRPPLHIPVRSVFAGLGTGVLTTLLFCLPPLLDIRNIRPSLVLRRAVEEGGGESKISFWKRIWNGRAQWVAVVSFLLGLAGIAAALSDSAKIGKWFAVGLAAALVCSSAAGKGHAQAAALCLSRTRLRLPSALRHGLANLYRPGNQSAAVLAALGTGVMLILTVFLMQKSVIDEIRLSASPSTPNVFLIDISTKELEGVRTLLSKQQGVRGQLESLPVVSGRIVSVDGVSLDQFKVENFPKRMLQSVALTWSENQPQGANVTSGKWWIESHEPSIALASASRSGFTSSQVRRSH